MNARDFLKAATDPDGWLRMSVTLRASANALWDCFFRATLQYAKSCAGERVGDVAKWDEAVGYLTVAKMLYGLALETVLKAYLLRHTPEEIEFRLSADGLNNLTSAEIRQFGVPMGEGHNLLRLAEKAGVFMSDEGAVFPIESDRIAVREILKHLGECVMWRSRYPIPKKTGEEHMPSPDVPAKVLGHYIRDWLDPLLDHLQSNISPSFEPENTVSRTTAVQNNPGIVTRPVFRG